MGLCLKNGQYLYYSTKWCVFAYLFCFENESFDDVPPRLYEPVLVQRPTEDAVASESNAVHFADVLDVTPAVHPLCPQFSAQITFTSDSILDHS